MFRWDEDKRAANLVKHGIDFASVRDFEFGTALVLADTRHDEPRLTAVGLVGDRLHVLVFTVETRSVRVISLRKANKREIRAYVEVV
jgi:Uncharacterized protein conserved in bacteria